MSELAPNEYRDLGDIPLSTVINLTTGRQLGFLMGAEEAEKRSYGLGVMSEMNIVSAALGAQANEGALLVSGNVHAGFTQGAGRFLLENYYIEDESPAKIPDIFSTNDASTLASAINVAPILKNLQKDHGELEIVIYGDIPQSRRLARMFRDQDIAISGIASAYHILKSSGVAGHEKIADEYRRHGVRRRVESAKQTVLGVVDPHGTSIEHVVRLVRPHGDEPKQTGPQPIVRIAA